MKLPMRSKRFGVGKEIGGAIYVHRVYEGVLPKEVQTAKGSLPDEFAYTVVKFDLQSKATTFTQSLDFDSADEPIVGESILIKADGSTKRRKQSSDPFIYHHKWLFVNDDYSGFDIRSSVERSLSWLSLPDVDTRRIGRRSYWEEHVAPRLTDDVGWMLSGDICKTLQISTCELSHRRNAGEIPFKKEGNTYYYRLDEST